MKKPTFIFLIFVFLLAEIILSVNEYFGVLIYALVLGLILVRLEEDDFLIQSDKLLIFMMILPIARISEVFVSFNFYWKTIMFYFVIYFLVLFYMRRFNISPGYTKSKLWFLPLSIIIGIYFGYIGNHYFGFEKHPEILFLLPFIVFSEELLFRGMIQNYAKKEYGKDIAIICTSLLFAIFSLSFGLGFAFFILLANLVMCMIYDKASNIWLTIPINFFMNLLLFVMIV